LSAEAAIAAIFANIQSAPAGLSIIPHTEMEAGASLCFKGTQRRLDISAFSTLGSTMPSGIIANTAENLRSQLPVIQAG